MSAILADGEMAKPSQHARQRFLETERTPFMLADWDRALFVHYAVPVEALQPFVPFVLDSWEGEAYVSLVAFTMRRLRLARGGRCQRAVKTSQGWADENQPL